MKDETTVVQKMHDQLSRNSPLVTHTFNGRNGTRGISFILTYFSFPPKKVLDTFSYHQCQLYPASVWDLDREVNGLGPQSTIKQQGSLNVQVGRS